ncbi:MAG: CBS domain-containing protein [Brevinematales bacterium]|nr:CBS domain-containing protein [Brevinematales bacterium]
MDLSNARVKEFMVSPVYYVGLKDPLTKIVDKMIKSKISGVIVLDKDRPVGMIYATDLIKYIFAPDKAKDITAEEIVEKQEEIVLNEDMLLKDALRLMISKNKRKLPVVNKKGDIVGVFSMVDVVRYLSELL